MNQIPHIFKKDLRRHYPEILMFLILLALYTRRELQFSLQSVFSVDARSILFYQVTQLITPILVLFWAFLILRVVQSDTLVGDRQWWITKPYQWWNLLAAKLLFISVFISVPLVLVQLFLLHRSGFSILHNLCNLFLMQFTLPLFITLFSLLLACLTRNLSQALLGVGILLAAIIVFSWLRSQFSSNTLDESSKFSQNLQSFLYIAPFIFVPIWQFARRKTWASRGTLIASFGAATLISIIPSANRVERSYPLVVAKDAPMQFAIPAITQAKKAEGVWPDYLTTAALIIPVNVSGVSPGTMILIDGINITPDSLQDSHWSRGWSGQDLQVWPEDQRRDLTYMVKRKEYEEIKSKLLNLHIKLLLSEYQESDARTLLVPPGVFQDSELGICRLTSRAPNAIQCLKPFQSPNYIARFDAPNSHCGSVRRSPNQTPTNLEVAYAWQPARPEFLPDPGLSPLVEYALGFNSVSHIPDANATPQENYTAAALCPGAEIRLSRPILKRQFRIQLDLPNIRLQDLIQEFPVGGADVSSINVRSLR